MDLSWDVKPVGRYRGFFNSNIIDFDGFIKSYELRRNLGYNLQYLEYLSFILKEDTHTVIYRLTIKTFLITGIGIIESILFYQLKKINKQEMNDFEDREVFHSNPKNIHGKILKTETRIKEKLDIPTDKKMSFVSIIHRSKSLKLVGNNSEIYERLDELRLLRNKVHLGNIESDYDHDYNNFTDKEYQLIRLSLKDILYSNLFTNEESTKNELFDFLI